jgi:hypothetical protein
VGFEEFGHTVVIPNIRWIFWNSFGGWGIVRAFKQAIANKILILPA